MRRPTRLRSLVLSGAGVIMEWYDFSLYLYMAPVLGRLFIPDADPRARLLMTYGLFAFGYVVRPLGALFYGVVGDRLGRRHTLVLSTALMSLCKLLEALLPTYASVGLAAPVLLLVLRMASGFSMGGEYAGTFVYLVETAPPARRGLTCSIANAMCALGIFLASLVVACVSLMGTPTVDTWGWRIPFCVGALVGLIALAMRTSLQESVLFDAAAARGEISRTPLRDALRSAPWRILAATALAAWIAVSYHLLVAFVPVWLQTYLNVDARAAGWIAAVASLLNAAVMFVPAWLSDRIGRRPVLIGAALAILCLAWPTFTLMAHGHVLLGALLAVPMAAAVNAPAATLAVELFPTRIRFSAFALGFNLGSIAGGVAPVVAAGLIARSEQIVAPSFVLMAASLCVLPLLWRLPETRDLELL